METIKKYRTYLSFQKEKLWLEEMAAQGWLLKNVFLHSCYTFEKCNPQKGCYEIDRYNLSKNPTLKQLSEKEDFMEIAMEMGWKILAHDEDLNYYYYKEYEENGINELYNDADARSMHGKKYYHYYTQMARLILEFSTIVYVLFFLLEIVNKQLSVLNGFFSLSSSLYILFAFLYSVFTFRLAAMHEKEFSQSREEWQSAAKNKEHITVKKLILTTSELTKFLQEQSKKGLTLVHMTSLTYVFQKSNGIEYDYAIDCKTFLNKRRKLRNESAVSDRKDILCANNDWQILSLKEAKQKDYEFVCAFENRSTVYKRDISSTKPTLNFSIHEKGIRLVSLLGYLGIVMIICGIVGGIIGGFVGYSYL